MGCWIQEIVLRQEDEAGGEGGALVAVIEGMILAKMEKVGSGYFSGSLDQWLAAERCLRSRNGTFQKAKVFDSGEATVCGADFFVNREHR